MNTPIRLLIVDDEPAVLQQVEMLFTRRGFTIRTCRTGEEALDLVLSYPFDAALVDVRMPGIDGVEVMHEMQRTRPNVPVILMSGYTDVNSQELIAEGAAAWLDKPFTDVDKVVDTIHGVIAKKNASGPKPPPRAERGPSATHWG